MKTGNVFRKLAMSGWGNGAMKGGDQCPRMSSELHIVVVAHTYMPEFT